MPALKQPKKTSRTNAPKKPSTRSKTGNSACSEAASNWQLAIRGKAPLNPDTYKTLGKCRAMSRAKKQAGSDQASGKLSEQGRNAVESRLQSRFDRGLITKKSRTERAKELIAKRAKSRQTGKGETVVTARLAPTRRGTEILKAIPDRRTLTQSKEFVRKVKQRELSKSESNSGVQTLKTGQIQADPERFQYKMNTSGPTGVTDQFQDTRVWNKELAGVIQVWKDPANNRTYVVNGHHRYDLAQRLGVRSLNVQYIQAKSAAEARQKGALTNIAEGRGTSVDAAKFLRDSNDPNIEKSLSDRGISLSERTASEGLALSRLPNQIWRKVIDETVPMSRAVAVGKSGLRQDDMLQLFNKAEKNNWTASRTVEFGKELKRAPLISKSSGNLFGDEEFVNTAEFRAQFADRFRGRMRTDANLFGKVARSRNAGRLEQIGQNKIDVRSSQEQAKQADDALQMFDIERNYGVVSRTLNAYAQRVGTGEKFDKVYPQFEAQVTKQLDNILNRETRSKRASEIRAMSFDQRRQLAKSRRSRTGK